MIINVSMILEGMGSRVFSRGFESYTSHVTALHCTYISEKF